MRCLGDEGVGALEAQHTNTYTYTFAQRGTLSLLLPRTLHRQTRY